MAFLGRGAGHLSHGRKGQACQARQVHDMSSTFAKQQGQKLERTNPTSSQQGLACLSALMSALLQGDPVAHSL